MRSYLNNQKFFKVADLKRLYADARRQARNAKTDVTFERNLNEAKAIGYALYVIQQGKAPFRGRPPLRAKFFLNRVSA